MAKVKITVRPNGPFRVEDPEGLVELVDADGKEIPMPKDKPWVSLCRCGASANKPFCDGAHKACFQNADLVVKVEGQK